MRLASVQVAGREMVVAVDEEGSTFAVESPQRSDPARARTLQDIIAAGPEVLDPIRSALATGSLHRVSVEGWLPPVPRPTKIVGVALNNGTFESISYRYFAKPAFFTKPPSCLIGHQAPIRLRAEYGLTHPEAELAAVIGKRTSNVSEADALDHIFGYTVINDITSVALKDDDSIHIELKRGVGGVSVAPWRRIRDDSDFDLYLTYHLRSKGTDTFGPMGPWIVTCDEIPNPDDLAIKAWLGEDLVANDSTANLSFSVSEVIAHLSRNVTLESGDIVHFGTAVDPRRHSLREADMLKRPGPVSIEIEKIGRLSNPIIVEE